jgi:hypothetical protein
MARNRPAGGLTDAPAQSQSRAFAAKKGAEVSRLKRLGRGAIVAALAFGASPFACRASAASGAAFCSSAAAPRAPVPVPRELEARVAAAFNLPADLVRNTGFVRCAGRRLLACVIGANLNCFKANARRSLPGASEFCSANPDADDIPMAATGHDTIYDWRCVGRRAVATKTVVAVDAQGYDAGNWKELDR